MNKLFVSLTPQPIGENLKLIEGKTFRNGWRCRVVVYRSVWSPMTSLVIVSTTLSL
jgi:hypothetical protein